MSLARTRGAKQQNVRLGPLHVFRMSSVTRLHTLVVVVDRDRQRTLRTILADHPRIQEVVDFNWLRQGQLRGFFGSLAQFLSDDFVAEVYALVADVDTGTADELAHLLLTLSTERALEQFSSVGQSSHVSPPSIKIHHYRAPPGRHT